MAEAAVLGMIQDLESLHVTCTDRDDLEMFEDKIVVLKEILDLLRNLKLEERSRLKYLIADLVELGQDVLDMDISWIELRLKCIKDEIQVTKMRMRNFGADENNIGDEEAEEEEVVVGLEKDMQKLLDRVILTKVKELRIMCIKGMIGVGKTTLARQVYKAGAGQFQRHAWVCASTDMSKKEILMKLIQQMVEGYERDPSLEEMDNRSLQRILCQHLQDMSYFIVLDNIPKEMGLDSIFRGLPSEGLTGSRLLFANRYVLRTGNINYTHEMSALDSDKSWQLFLKIVDKITCVENKFSKELERKGREMLKKCGGLPMAIKNVARQKAKQRLSGIDWEQLFDSIDLIESLKLLEPMYHQLKERFKPQFLHFSFFKENALMRETKLRQIWDANGLYNIPVTREFVDSSILKVAKQHFCQIKCHLHPLLHMISIKKAEEEMGLEILRSNGNSRPSQNARHRVIHCGRDRFNHFTKEDCKQLISLVFHGGGRYLDDVSQSYWKSFEALKILDIEDFGLKSLSETIGTLIELRYLGLRNNYIQEIPRSLADLENLEVLDIALNFMMEVPNIIWHMGNLCHLNMSDVIFRKPLTVDALQNIRSLAYISIYDWTCEDPNSSRKYKLLMLGFEDVDGNSDVGKLFKSLAKLPNFYELSVRGFRFRSMPCLDEICFIKRLKVLKLDGRIGRLPSADNLPQQVEYIALINTCLDKDPMPILEKLSSLSKLKLRNAYTGREMVIQEDGFPELELLCINELWNLRNIQVDEDAMLNLRKLEINNCPHLETLPEWIRSNSELQKFKMVTTKHIATKIRNSGLTSEIIEEDIYP
ncbi:probable disease resistance protein RF9 [Salvia hispanica]|uniref:probable disease resistance protein RF9 n=1 Tax=Salvia hispanica TaxID=49212 RepID=UPI0020091A0F|nr:probable disease resistance protein RF9 [Salvia hispanica]XP_047946780.1 probable disease resistance protein RF9 [Salvia hispanica]XP_047946781.1 probable disease resistance protein RF9 [Salvia hispanica]XP_047946782.1 probable disease resistance protein RF9 [Salvia hispanica]XP_047946783.1 probable disease resistance protein RF9 [Salvia hispanica]XP_047946784.1 probable disease resistance protein RF9 [Salvia hispanica]